MKRLKIGITFMLKSNDESIWTSGIHQNILMLVHLLKNSNKNYDICLLNGADIDLTKKPEHLKDIDVHYYEKKFLDMDLIIVMGFVLPNQDIKRFKENGDKKIIVYKCGNNYVLSMEEMLFHKKNKAEFELEKGIDEVWYVPQQHEMNDGYYSVLYRTNVLAVPFIWHNKFIDESAKSIQQMHDGGHFKNGPHYQVGKEKKLIGVLEPNINIVKFCLIPTLIIEKCYRGDIGKKLIEKMRITNANGLEKDPTFLSLIKSFDLFKDGKITAEHRYQTPYILSQYLDVVVSHQILNPLNYLYLDVAHMGYPILHNATLCKDLGYYYEGSNVNAASKLLEKILTKHDKNIDEYNKKNTIVLQRYHADNEKLVSAYDTLIENVWKGGNDKLVYDPKTNLCTKRK